MSPKDNNPKDTFLWGTGPANFCQETLMLAWKLEKESKFWELNKKSLCSSCKPQKPSIHALPCAAGTVPWQEVSGPRISVGPGHYSLELTFCWREAALMYCTVLIDLMAFSYKVSVRRAQAGRALEVLQNLFILWQWIL